MDKLKKLLVITEDEYLEQLLHFCFDGWGYKVFFEHSQATSIDDIVKISPDLILVDITSVSDPRFDLCDVIKSDFSTSFIPVVTLIEKDHLKEKLLDLREGVDDFLIKPPDPLDLRIRTEIAMKRSQHSFYANPLTGLSGGIVIEDAIRSRMQKKENFVVGHIDIDNFKSFNDKYGYLRGDMAIMQTAYMLSTVVRRWGSRGDFVGHVGGDDFVVITTCEKYKEICQNFICMFDTIMPFQYSEEDRLRGYIVSKGRTNRLKKIPLMSVTISLVVKNSAEEFKTIIEINERIAEVKGYLKKIPGSKYMADRRIINKDDYLTLQVFNNDDSIIGNYRPLGQILVKNNLLTKEQLDKALKTHWRRGVSLGEVLKDMGFVDEDRLYDALVSQENGLYPAPAENER